MVVKLLFVVSVSGGDLANGVITWTVANVVGLGGTPFEVRRNGAWSRCTSFALEGRLEFSVRCSDDRLVWTVDTSIGRYSLDSMVGRDIWAVDTGNGG